MPSCQPFESPKDNILKGWCLILVLEIVVLAIACMPKNTTSIWHEYSIINHFEEGLKQELEQE